MHYEKTGSGGQFSTQELVETKMIPLKCFQLISAAFLSEEMGGGDCCGSTKREWEMSSGQNQNLRTAIVFTIETVIADVRFKIIIFAGLYNFGRNWRRKEMVLTKNIGRSSIGKI